MASDFFRILVHHRLRDQLQQQNTRLTRDIQEVLERLQFGYWGNGIRVKALKGVRKPVYEARVTRAIRLLFTVVRTHETQPPYDAAPHVLVWDVVGHDHIDRARRMNIVPETGFLDFAAYSNIEIDAPPECPEVVLPATDTDDLRGDLNNPRLVPSNEPLVESIRWYEIAPEIVADEDEWQALIDDTSVDDLELKLSREQAENVYRPGPLLLRGTAGSGKTTVSVYRLARLILEQPDARVLYVTYSEALLNTVRQLFHDLFRSRRLPLPRVPDFVTFPQLYREITGSPQEPLRFAAFERWYSMAYRLPDAALAWEEIRGIIKGACLDTNQPGLSQQAYEQLGRKRAPLFTQERPRLYRVFTRYQRWLAMQQAVDDVDLARQAHQQLREPHRYDHLICDEGQDLTEVELQLLLRLVRTPQGLLLAADPQQIVNPSGFRWAEIRSLLRRHNPNQGAPVIHALTRNFRSVDSIVSLANALLTIQRDRTGRSDDDDLQQTTLHGTAPVLVEGAEAEVAAHIRNFGPRCAVIAMSSTDRDRLAEILGSERVFSVRESKGLEFDACVLWNPLSADAEIWRRLLETDEPLREDPVSRRAIHHAYVAVTRARRYLGIYESSADIATLWDTPALRSTLERDTPAALSKFMVFASSPEAWEEEGDYFLSRGRFRQAAECFRRAGCRQREQEARAGHFAACREFHPAAELYESLALWGKAADCRRAAGDFRQAGILFSRASNFAEAAPCLEQSKQWEAAAFAYQQLSQQAKAQACHLHHAVRTRNWQQAAQLAQSLGHTAQAIEYFRRAGMHRQADELELQDASYLDRAEASLRKQDFQAAAHLFKQADQPARAAACLAEHCQQRHDWAAAAQHWQQAGNPERARVADAHALRATKRWFEAAVAYYEVDMTKDMRHCLQRATSKRGRAMADGFKLWKQNAISAALAFEDAGLYELSLSAAKSPPPVDITAPLLRARAELRLRLSLRTTPDHLHHVAKDGEDKTLLLAAEIAEQQGDLSQAAKFCTWAHAYERAQALLQQTGRTKELARVKALAAEQAGDLLTASDHWQEAGRMKFHHQRRAEHFAATATWEQAARHYEQCGMKRKAAECRAKCAAN